MPALRKIAFVLEDWKVPSPGQQLLDRFLIGYPYAGKFKTLNSSPSSGGITERTESLAVALHVHSRNKQGLTDEREKRGLLVGELAPTLAHADAVVVVPAGSGSAANDGVVAEVLAKVQPNTRCFVYGAVAADPATALEHVAKARERSVSLVAGTPLAVTWRLPDIELPQGTRITDALIVVPEKAPEAELNGWDGLLPIIARRRRGEAGVKSLECFQGGDVWRALDADRQLWPLVAAAFSRSSSPLGDAVVDGRTQDLVGLRLVQQLSADPRAWIAQHRDGLRSIVLSVPGAIGDINVAVRRADGVIYSVQLYRPPKPEEHSFSRLAWVLEDFFRTGKSPWPIERNLLLARLLAACRKTSTTELRT